MISLLCPTRERVHDAVDYVDSVFATADNPDQVELIIALDNDDPMLEQYKQRLDKRVKLFINPRFAKLSTCWNQMTFMSKGDMVMLANDDLRHRSHHWDMMLCEAARKHPDGIFCAWGPDGIHKDNQASFPVVGRKVVEVLGYYLPEIFQYFYVDTWIFDIIKRVGRLEYIPTLFIEHMHICKQKRQPDALDAYNRRDNALRNDRELFQQTSDQREQEASKLRAYIKSVAVCNVTSSACSGSHV